MAALDGLLVVALEQAVAAPYASRLLADAGARVIKIERAEGDFARHYDRAANGASSYFVWLNRGKQSIALDIKQEADAALLRAMLARADVFIQNLAPGAAARAGFGADDLRAQHQRLITCEVSGYPADGPQATRKAYDLLIQAETGLAAITGTPEGPGRVGISVADIATGHAAYAAILEALLERGRTGRGRHVAVSLFGTLTEWMAVPYLHARYGSGAPKRVGLAHPSIAPYGVFATQVRPLLISIQNEREWRSLCATVMGDAAMAHDARFADGPTRVANRTELDALVAARFLALPYDKLTARLDAADIAWAPVNEVADLIAHPDLRTTPATGAFGRVDLPLPPGGHDALPAQVPAVDEHGAAIRVEFGV